MDIIAIPLGLVLFILALVFLWQSGRQRRSAGLPGGRVIYTDTSQWGPVEEPLYHPLLELSGKPDYLIEQSKGRRGRVVIPVEVKSGRTPDAPYDGHIFQLAAYCALVEREYGVRPPYGIIHFEKRTFAVDYTEALEDALLDLLVEMRATGRKRDVDRSHDQIARCRGCGYREECEQAL